MIGKRDIKMYRDSKPLNIALLKKIDYCIENSSDTRSLNYLFSLKESYVRNRKATASQIKILNIIHGEIKKNNDKLIDELLSDIIWYVLLKCAII